MNHISVSQMNIVIGSLTSNDNVYIHNIIGVWTDVSPVPGMTLPVLLTYCRITMYSKYDMRKCNIAFGPVNC